MITIQKLWESFRDNTIDGRLSSFEEEEARQGFYSGFGEALLILQGLSPEGFLPTKEQISVFAHEIADHSESMMRNGPQQRIGRG